MRTIWILSLSVAFFLILRPAWAKKVAYTLTISQVEINVSGKRNVDFALLVNGSIPAPTLEFTEGDDAEITVVNNLPRDEEVSIHWHGILLPPEEDGVAYVNTPPIHRGQSRTFRFRLRQHGTYWYHSHTGMQEQKGVYGAFIVHPKQKGFVYDRDAVVVISDWSDENPDQIVKNLRKDGDFYLYKKDSVRSYWGAIRAGGLANQLYNEWTRMGGMDLSDVGYDAFLLNGKRSLALGEFKAGERVRVRLINAAASTYFYIALGKSPMEVIAADGVDIQPVSTQEILMGMAETYDLLVTVPKNQSLELRATAQDGTGWASAWIGKGEKLVVPDRPLPDFYAKMDHGGHGAHGKADQEQANSAEHAEHGGHHPNAAQEHHSAHDQHASHAHHASTHQHASHGDGSKPKAHHDHRSGLTKEIVPMLTVDQYQSPTSTAFAAKHNVHRVKLVLGGDMERYVWHINGKAIHQDRNIEINEGDVVQFTFVNETMMHHPMHLHGHFFRVLNASGEKSPLKHTVDVEPHSTRTIEFLANEPGQWMLHCHNLYHMKNGMARVVKYSTWKPRKELEHLEHQDPHMHEHLYWSAKVAGATNHALGQAKLLRTWDEVLFQIEARNTTKRLLQFQDSWEWEGDVLYRRYLSNYFSLTGGGTFVHERAYGIIGAGYLLPFLLHAHAYLNHEGKFRLDVERRFQWTSTIFSDLELRWRPKWKGTDDPLEFTASLLYGPSWYWAAGLFFTEKSLGLGAQVRF